MYQKNYSVNELYIRHVYKPGRPSLRTAGYTVKLLTCPICGEKYEVNDKFCMNCGKKL